MIWNNCGHQLDNLGERYVKIKNVLLFGISKESEDMYNFLLWLNLQQDFNISFIWDETEHENECVPDSFCDRKVIKYNGSTNVADITNDIDETVVVLPSYHHTRRRALLEKKGIYNIFYLHPDISKSQNFVQNFLCIYMLYKHNKLVSHWTNFLTTSKCNLDCKGCLNFNHFIKIRKDVSMEEFQRHFDVLFSKFDYLYSLHFTGGESFLVKDLSEKINWLKEKYGNRIYDFFVITNGTIIPSDSVVKAIKDINGWVFIDDYSDSIEDLKIREVIKKLEENGVKYQSVRAEYWYDIGIDYTDNSHFSEQDLEQHKDSCNRYLHEFAGGRIYSCCYQEYAHRVEKIEDDEDGYVDIEKASKMEILEFRQGFTKKGYVNMCKKCVGLGTNGVQIKAAEQIRKQ